MSSARNAGKPSETAYVLKKGDYVKFLGKFHNNTNYTVMGWVKNISGKICDIEIDHAITNVPWLIGVSHAPAEIQYFIPWDRDCLLPRQTIETSEYYAALMEFSE